MLKAGDKAPEFTLLDQDGKSHSLSAYRGKWVLLYFYPKDDTPGCTKEACSMRDNMPAFKKLDMVILGVSTDAVKSHKKFSEKFALNFPILADDQKEVVNAYQVWQPKKFMGREFLGTLRVSFLINPEGNIAKVYEKVKPELHAEEVATDAKEFGVR
jgi:peroxiredoxin Q/BCP